MKSWSRPLVSFTKFAGDILTNDAYFLVTFVVAGIERIFSFEVITCLYDIILEENESTGCI